MRARDAALAVVPQLCWGIAFPLAKPALTHFPPLMAMALAYAITALVVVPLVGFPRRTGWTRILPIALMAGSVQAALLFWGLARLPASTAMILVQAQTPFALLAAWAISGERPSARAVLGIAVALAGVLIVAGAPELPGSLWPVLAILGCALAWAIGQVLIGRLARDPGIVVTGGVALHSAWQLAFASLLLETGQREVLGSASVSHWALLVALALIGFVLAYTVWYGLLARLRIDQVIPFTLLLPVITVAFAALVLGERPSAVTLGGCGVVLAGLAVIVLPKRRAPSAQFSSASSAR